MNLHGASVSLYVSRISLCGSQVRLLDFRVSLHGSRVSFHGSRVILEDLDEPPFSNNRKNRFPTVAIITKLSFFAKCR
jgi:hypothetical protein